MAYIHIYTQRKGRFAILTICEQPKIQYHRLKLMASASSIRTGSTKMLGRAGDVARKLQISIPNESSKLF